MILFGGYSHSAKNIHACTRRLWNLMAAINNVLNGIWDNGLSKKSYRFLALRGIILAVEESVAVTQRLVGNLRKTTRCCLPILSSLWKKASSHLAHHTILYTIRCKEKYVYILLIQLWTWSILARISHFIFTAFNTLQWESENETVMCAEFLLIHAAF